MKRALSLVLLGFFAFTPMVSRAAMCSQQNSGYQTCKIEEIVVTLDTYPGQQSQNPDNYMRLVKGKDLTLSAKITLSSPDKLNLTSNSTDELDFTNAIDQAITGFGFGVTTPALSKQNCGSDSKMNFLTLGAGSRTSYQYCTFAKSLDNQKQAEVINKGEILMKGTITIPASSLASDLSISSAGRYEIYVMPNMFYTGGNPITFMNVGKSVFLDVYQDQAALDAANAAGPRPTDGSVPTYGSVSGSSKSGEEGGPLWGIINKIVGFLLGIIQEIIYAIFYFLIVPIIQAMLSIRVYTDTFVSVIYPGWIVLRNLCNIIFIVAIMAIAMGTLLRVDAYKSRSVLVQLILAALLVNFSLVIAQVVLGIADTVQSQFLPNNQEVIRALGKDLMVAYRSEVYNLKLGGYFSDIVKQFMFLILACGSFMVFLAIAAFLFIRMIMLWILLMLSPLAYAAGALPSTAHYRKEWWTTFLKYAFFTPIMAFFLNMTAIISNTYKSNPIFGSLGVKDSDFGDSSLAGFIFRVGSTLLLIVFLLVALKVAESFSIYGASEVSKFAKKGMFAPVGAAKLGAGYLGRKYNEATAKIRGHEEKVSFKRAAAFAVANPAAFIKGIKKQSEERTHRAQAKAEAVGLEVAEQRFSSPKAFFKGSYKINPHVLQHEKEEEDEQAKKLQNLSREEVAKRAAQIFKMGDSEEDLAYKRGVIKLAMSKGYIDDIVMEAHKNAEGRDMVKAMMEMKDKNGNPLLKEGRDYKKTKVKDEHGNMVDAYAMEYNHATRRAMYMAMFGVSTDSHGHQTLKDHAAMRLITQEGEKEGMDTGHLEYMTDMRFNEQTGHYEFYDLKADENDQWVSQGEIDMAGKEIAKRDSRTQARIAWHSLLSSDGQSFSKAIFARVAKAISENPGFMQERQANKLLTGSTDVPVVEQNVESLRSDNELLVDENFASVISKMAQTDERATATLIQRFLNDTSKEAVDKRMKNGVNIRIVKRDKDGNITERADSTTTVGFPRGKADLETKSKPVKEAEEKKKNEDQARHEALLKAIQGLAGGRGGTPPPTGAPPMPAGTILGPDGKPLN